ncbi:MAG TPA: AAA family ATPase [Firmicutes bacterium]|nr:AAA family ATPase [Candidatus Fermentithermobacillaceae bacterium]
MPLTDLFEKTGEVFRLIAETSGGSIELHLGKSRWMVKYTPIILEVDGLLYDAEQDLLGLLFLDDGGYGSDSAIAFLGKVAYCAERSKATAQALGKLPFDWHVFMVSGRSDLGEVISQVTSHYKSVPFGVSLLYAPDPNKVQGLSKTLQDYQQFLQNPGGDLPKSQEFLEVVKFFAPLLPYSRSHLLKISDPLASLEPLLLKEIQQKLSDLLENEAAGWPQHKKEGILKRLLSTLPNIKSTQVTDKLLQVQTLAIQHFRALRLDGPIPLSKYSFITGGNGTGKTSVIEAIEFGLTGKISRFQEARGNKTEQEIALRNILVSWERPIEGTVTYLLGSDSGTCELPATEETAERTKVVHSCLSKPTNLLPETFSRIALTQDRALEVLKISDEDRYRRILDLIGIDTKSIADAFEQAQARINDLLKPIWSELGMRTQLKVGVANVRSSLKTTLDELLKPNKVPCPQNLALLHKLWQQFSSQASSMSAQLYRGVRLSEDQLGDFDLRWREVEEEFHRVDLRYRLSDSTLIDKFNKAARLLEEWERHLKTSAATQGPRLEKKSEPLEAENLETPLAAIEYLKQIQLFVQDLARGRKVLEELKERAASLLSQGDDSVLRLLSGTGVNIDLLISFIAELRDALQYTIDRIDVITASSSDSTLKQVQADLELTIKSSPTTYKAGPVKAHVIQAVLEVSEVVSAVLNVELSLSNSLATPEETSALRKRITDVRDAWISLRNSWLEIDRKLESVSTIRKVFVFRPEDGDANIFEVALESDILAAAEKALKDIEERTVINLVKRTWFTGWLEFSSLLSASRWGQINSILECKSKYGKDSIRIAIPVPRSDDVSSVKLDLVYNQGEQCLASLAWFLLGYALHGRHSSDVIIIDDPFFALDPAHQRYAIEGLIRALRIINKNCQLIISVALQDEVCEFLTRFSNASDAPQPLLDMPQKPLQLAGSDCVTLITCERITDKACKVAWHRKIHPGTLDWRKTVLEHQVHSELAVSNSTADR